MQWIPLEISKLFLEIFIFIILVFIFSFIFNKAKNSPSKVLKIGEYFPEEELHSLKQIFYLIMMGLVFIDVLYAFIGSDFIFVSVYDIVLSLFIATTLDKSSLKNKILILLLVPYGSLTFVLFGFSIIGFVDLIHVPVFIYFIKIYYDRFKEYTESNGLGITIILLFSVVFISFFITQIVENVNALDALNIVSNAFTSNGYAILGHSIAGKIDSIVLVWAGYLLSGVGTATLTAAILMRHFNSRLDELEELIRKNDED